MTFLRPDWPAPAWVRAATTTRQGGVSQPPFDSFNLGGHVGDAPADVAANRQHLREILSLPGEPYWLNQIHGTTVVDLDDEPGGLPEADACITSTVNSVCAVLTADCLPVLFCDQAGTQVAAAHAGWRGLAAGVLEATVASRDPYGHAWAIGCPRGARSEALPLGVSEGRVERMPRVR